jgi:hypothetical protein
MSEELLYRVGLKYWVADWFAGELPPDYADGADIDSLADDRFQLAEPSLGLFPAVRFFDDADPSALESCLGEVDVTQKPAEVAARRGVVKELDSRTHIVVIIRPEFDVAALRAEIAERVRACGGEAVLDEVPNAERYDTKQGYYVVYDDRGQSAYQSGNGVLGRFRDMIGLSRSAPEPPSDSEDQVDLDADAQVRAVSPKLTLTKIEQSSVAMIQNH